VNDPKVKAEIAAQVLPLIEDLPNPVEREHYRQLLARRLRVDERAMFGSQPARTKPYRRVKPKEQQPQPEKTESASGALAGRQSRDVEAYCLAILLKHPELLHRLDRDLQKASLGPLSIQDFEYTDHQEFFQLVRQSLEQDATETRHYVEQHMDEDLRDLFAELSAQTIQEPLQDRLVAELYRSVIRLRRVMISESVSQLQFLQQEAQQSGDPLAATYVDLATQYGMTLQHLHLALARRDEKK
jgi:DNA primase